MSYPEDGTYQKFRAAMTGLGHEWGFVIIRTTFSPEDDDTQWTAALAKLRTSILASTDNGNSEMNPNTLALPVIADRALDGASYHTVRTAFNTWVSRYKTDADGEWPSDIRSDCCFMIDGAALTSLLNTLEPSTNPEQQPYIIAVDATNPSPHASNVVGGPYLGWMRVLARATGPFFKELKSRSMGELCPRRVYEGQVPLYDNMKGGKLVDPPGGVEGHYQFPRGKPRVVDARNPRRGLPVQGPPEL